MNNHNVPSYVRKLPEQLQDKWTNLVSTARPTYGTKKAMVLANTVIQKDLREHSRPFIKRCSITLEIDKSKGFIKRSSSGDDYITFVLNSTDPHSDGTVFSEDMLKSWAEDINKNPTLVGDVDHMFYDQIIQSTLSDEQVRNALKGKKGIAKMVQAIYEKGKLWVRAIIDKRYKKIIENAKGVSAEAWYSETEGNVIKQGDLLGFSFNVQTSPADYGASIVA